MTHFEWLFKKVTFLRLSSDKFWWNVKKSIFQKTGFKKIKVNKQNKPLSLVFANSLMFLPWYLEI